MKTRVISSLAMLAIFFSCFFISTVSRVIFFGTAAFLCAYEMCDNFKKHGVNCSSWVLYAYVAIEMVLILLDVSSTASLLLFAMAIYAALFSGIMIKSVGGQGALCTIFSLAYPTFLFAVLMRISCSDMYMQTFALACFGTWTCDTFAYICGRKIGKHKLAPEISPSKSVEGAVCGTIAAALSGIAVFFILKSAYYVPLWLCILVATISSSLGQIGDLAESLIKRMMGLKDFSNLIPGHGGMFDRADSLLFSIPTAYLCLFAAGIGI